MRNNSVFFALVGANVLCFFHFFFKLTHLLNYFASNTNEILTHFATNEILAEGIQNQVVAERESQLFSTFGSSWTLV